MPRTLLVGSAAALLLASGGCRRLQRERAERQAAEQAQAAPEPAPVTGETPVVDQRPSARYRVEQRPPRIPAEQREPAIEIEEVASQRAVEGGREADALVRAREFRAMGDVQSALAELERAIAINPRFTPALLEAGDLHMEMGELSLAERAYAAAARSQPDNFDAQYRHASALQQLGRTDEAVRAYLRSLAVRPDEFDAVLGLSTAYLGDGDAEQALPYAQRATRNRPRSGEARMHLGTVFAALGRHEEAVIEYRQAAELLPKPAPGLLLNMAESFNQLGRYAEMVGALSEVVAAEPTPIAYERLGSGLFRLKRYEESLDAFNRSVELDPSYAPGLNGLAVCELNNYLWSGKTDGAARERAVDAMRRSLRIDRSQPKIVELLRRYSQPSPEERRAD